MRHTKFFEMKKIPSSETWNLKQKIDSLLTPIMKIN